MRAISTLAFGLALAGAILAQQPNSTNAYQTINAIGGTTATGPFFVNLSGGSTVTLVIGGGGPNRPFILANANPGLGGIMAATGTPIGFGLLDIGPPSLPPIEFILDGFTYAGTLLGALATTGSASTTTLSFNNVGAGAPCASVLANLQTAILSPSSPGGILLTAAHQVRITPPLVPDAAPVLISMCDDCTTVATVSLCNSFRFYGAAYQQYFVNSNGSVSFSSGDASLGESQAAFNTNARSKIAAAWDDLYPGSTAGSTLTKFDNGTSIVVQWTNVAEFSATGSNTLSIRMDLITYQITMTYGALSLTDCLTGITPGGNGSTTLATPATIFGPGALNGRMISHLATSAGAPYVGASMESMNELFVTAATATSAPFNLANQVAVFTPYDVATTAYILN